jgi:hypothetical protein
MSLIMNKKCYGKLLVFSLISRQPTPSDPQGLSGASPANIILIHRPLRQAITRSPPGGAVEWGGMAGPEILSSRSITY